MTDYAVYNLGLAAVLVPISLIMLKRGRFWFELGRAVRVGLTITLIGFPWDFFAIRQGVWNYPKSPGLIVHGVPVNDLVFMWLCSYFAASVLIWSRLAAGSKGHPERKHAS